jgi:GntR family transcriptional regulator/MocR family aminotransferase
MQGLDRAGRVIYVGTLSKVLFPALRIGYLVLPAPLVEPFCAAKWLTDRHTGTLEQEVLAEFIQDGSFERHLRRSRTCYAARRAALLQSLADYLPERAEVVGANAGLHLLVWLRGISPNGADKLVQRAAGAGVGLYPIAPYYLRPPRRVGLLLGYAGLTEASIRTGIRRLAGVL